MPQIPQVTRETRLDGTASPYIDVKTNGDMFGANIAHAAANLGGALNNAAKTAARIQNTIEDAKILELSNSIDQWEQENLYDKEKGYFHKIGKDAVGKAPEIMKSYDDFVKDYISNSRLTPIAQARMNSVVEHKKTRIMYGVNNHDVQQTNNWAKIESQKGIDNAINGMIHARNNIDELKIQMANGLQVVRWQGITQNLDEDTIAAMEKDFKTKAHEAVLNTFLQDRDLQAGAYFEKYKNEIRPDVQAKYIGAIKNQEMKYKARNIADNIIVNSSNESDAVKRAEGIKDIDLSDIVVSRIKRHFSEQEQFKNQAQKELLNTFYNKAIQIAQNGGTLSYDDIPDDLDPDVKLSLMNYVNTKGQPETDDEIWKTLYEESVNDAQGFAKEDLNKYRGFLSDGEYKSFVKRQEEIKSGNFYTQIKDDDKMLDAALKAIGLSSNTSVFGLTGKNKDIAYSEIRSMVRELEARKGRKISDEELQNITNSLGYKNEQGNQLYKELEKGMREKVGFIRDVINDFTYYQTKHNGQLPSDEEKMKIIQNRLNQKIEEKKSDAKNTVSTFSNNATTMRNIAYTQPKPNEQKVLTYFADNQIPTIAKQLNLNLVVTSRYRNQAGSHHGEGRAADISMSEHSVQNKIRIYEKMLNLPTVKAIGTSDPNILAHFAGNSKIVDERRYDRQHGTNHINHAHVTLINANPATQKSTVVQSPKNGVYKY